MNIVIVRVTFRFFLPHCNNARNSVNEYILHCIFTEVQTRLLLAEGEGFEPPEAFTSTVFKTAAIDRSAILPYRPPQMAAVFCCFQALSRLFFGSARLQITFSSGAPHSEHAPKRRPSCKTPFSSGAPLSEPVQAPFSTVCAEEEERQSACARVRADDVPDVVILDLMPREIGF